MLDALPALNPLTDTGGKRQSGAEKHRMDVLMGASVVVGCAADSQKVVPGATRSAHYVNQYTYGDGPPPTSTPNPIDPDSGLKIIGGVTANYNVTQNSYQISADYGEYPGQYFNSKMLQIEAKIFLQQLKQCSVQIASTIGAAQVFVDKAFAAFGPRLTAAIGGASITSLTVWEAVGVALATLTAAEVAGIALAAGVTVTLLYAAFVCVGNSP